MIVDSGFEYRRFLMKSEKDEMRRTSLHMPVRLLEEVTRIAQIERISRAEVIRYAVFKLVEEVNTSGRIGVIVLVRNGKPFKVTFDWTELSRRDCYFVPGTNEYECAEGVHAYVL